MKNNLSPTYQYLFGDYWLLWYSISNSYSIIDPSFKKLLDYYLDSNTLESFYSKVNIDDKSVNPKTIAETINSYLNNSNQPLSYSKNTSTIFNTDKKNILKQYNIRGKAIRINYDSDLVLKTIHPALTHLSVPLNNVIDITFDIYLKNNELCLYKDEHLISCVPKRDYHIIQGKFIMQLLCTIHEKEEKDWISTFHGSTITDGKSSILFIGESGKGKSTLCALLSSYGFDLLADDVSPMLSKNKNIYFNPSAISIKEGAFSTLKSVVKNLDDLPVIQFNKTKGLIKYLPCSSPKKDSYPCRAIVLVNYKDSVDTELEKVSIKTILETLIPESWLSSNSAHAEQFLDWLITVNFYKLTYSNTKSVTKSVSELFNKLNKSL